MKACVIQPPYYSDYSKSDECFAWQLNALDKCDGSMDLIVLPENADTPCYADTEERRRETYRKYNGIILNKAAETARRCDAVVFVNAISVEKGGWRNTTYAFNRKGEVAGKYYKQHPTNGEVAMPERDSGYSYVYEPVTIIEIDGLRYAFLTCYDFYFYEAFARIARFRPDIIIGCSHQRTDTHDALETICKFCAYNTNAYLVRASVSMGEDSPVGGVSCIVAPTGRVLANLKSKAGMATAEFDPKEKYYKPAGFNGPLTAHYEYIEQGRRPWKYRPAGSAVICPEDILPYPRVCAHRGFYSMAPENSMPAYGAAVALGADEIEFDLWATADGEIVSIHDSTLDRVSTGTGKVYEHTYDELLRYDFGIKSGESFRGLKIITFEEILKKFACHVIMNIHIKEREPYDDGILEKIVALIREYDCEKYVYFMTSDYIHKKLIRIAPEIERCCAAVPDNESMVDRALELGCKKIQFVTWHPFTREMIEKAHANGLTCNICAAETPEEAEKFLDMGIDTIMANDFYVVSETVKAYKAKSRADKRKW